MQNSPIKTRAKLSCPVVAGKNILELLSSAMYVDPLSVYREYLQNSVDALDGIEGGRRARAEADVEIFVNSAERSIRIRDYGIGVCRAWFERTLTSIGASKKRGTSARGFRGVGRLAGLGYCQEVVMRSRSEKDESVMEMFWDCRKLKELLREPKESSLDEVLSETVNTSVASTANFPAHFFEVEMRQVGRFKNDVLLNESALRHYLSQIAPVPFDPAFSFGPEIEKYLAAHGVAKTYKVVVNGQQVFRPFRDDYELKAGVKGKFTHVEKFEIPGLSDGNDAVGWILHSDYLGAIPERHGVHGLRLRVGNIQIGDARLLDVIFPQPRFNAWCVAECHIISPKLVPNARRDDFEANSHYINLVTHLQPRARAILKACREFSAKRTNEKKRQMDQKAGAAAMVNWQGLKSFVGEHGDSKLRAKHKSLLLAKLNNGGVTYSELIRMMTDTGAEARKGTVVSGLRK